MVSNSTLPHIAPTAFYGYVPTLWVCSTFVALFGITTIIHLGQALLIKPRLYWTIPTLVLCGIGETTGWSARLWNSKNPVIKTAFMIQITTTIIAPVFLTAALYTILGLLIEIFGLQYSRLKPKGYMKIFVTADVIALLVQAVGGALASIANTLSQANFGANIVIGGIFLQMAAMLCYAVLATESILRFYLQRPLKGRKAAAYPGPPAHDDLWKIEKVNGRAIFPGRIGLLVLGLALATLFVFIRTIYRSVELLNGWGGHVIRTEIYFNYLDATPIAAALFVLNIFSPTFLLRTETNGLR